MLIWDCKEILIKLKNLDKMLEKICSGTNLNIFIGNKPQIKIKRQANWAEIGFL